MIARLVTWLVILCSCSVATNSNGASFGMLVGIAKEHEERSAAKVDEKMNAQIETWVRELNKDKLRDEWKRLLFEADEYGKAQKTEDKAHVESARVLLRSVMFE